MTSFSSLNPPLTDIQWQSEGSFSFSKAMVDGQLTEIGIAQLAISLESPTLAILCVPSPNNPKWSYGGRLIASTRLPIVSANQYASFFEQKLAIGMNLIRLPELDSDQISIYVRVPKWFNQVEYFVWTAVNQPALSIEDRQNLLYQGQTSIKSRLDNLNVAVADIATQLQEIEQLLLNQ